MNKEKTDLHIDLQDLWDVIWKDKRIYEEAERRDIPMGTFIRDYKLRPLFKKKD